MKDRELAIVPPILLQIPGLKALLLKSTDDMVQKLLDKYADVSAANPLSKVRRRCPHAAATISHALCSCNGLGCVAGGVMPRPVTMRLGRAAACSHAAFEARSCDAAFTPSCLPIRNKKALVR